MCFLLSSVLKSKYNVKEIVKKEAYIISELEKDFKVHFADALSNFEKVMKAFSGANKDVIQLSIRGNGLEQ